MSITPPHSSRRAFTLIELLVVVAIIAILAAILFPVFGRARENGRRTSCLSNQKQIGLGLMQYTQDYDDQFPGWREDLSEASATHEPSFIGDGTTAGWWQSRTQPYIKSGDPANGNNTGVWKCPNVGAGSGTGETETSYSYAYSGHFLSSNVNGSITAELGTAYYRYPKLAEMDEPTSTIIVGETGISNRMASPRGFQTYIVGPGSGWERPKRHLEGANYLFADGHAKWLKSDLAFPSGPDLSTAAQRTSATTPLRPAAYRAIVNYFAYNSVERNVYRRLLGEAAQ